MGQQDGPIEADIRCKPRTGEHEISLIKKKGVRDAMINYSS
jgi:hypothetical protein